MTQRRCEVRTRGERCPEVAIYRLSWQDTSGEVCERCLLGWLHKLTEHGAVEVHRLDGPDHHSGPQSPIALMSLREATELHRQAIEDARWNMGHHNGDNISAALVAIDGAIGVLGEPAIGLGHRQSRRPIREVWTSGPDLTEVQSGQTRPDVTTEAGDGGYWQVCLIDTHAGILPDRTYPISFMGPIVWARPGDSLEVPSLEVP